VARKKVAAVVLLTVVLTGAGVYAYDALSAPSTCSPLGGRTQLRSELRHVDVTALTEWQLPDPARFPNSVATAPDGSVWLGEQSVPGVAHFFPDNGTLVEYAWPGSAAQPQSTCSLKASIWGIALWKGMVWATSQDQNSIVGLNPANGSFRVLVLPQPDSSPYSLTAGPDGALWFTAISSTALIGRVSPSLTISMYPVLQQKDQIPTEIQFVNSSLAYFTALNVYNSTRSGLYSFDPGNASGGITPTRVGGNVTLSNAISLAVSSDSVWVVQHIASNIAGYNLNSHRWTLYPTSTENYTSTTLPYFVRTSGNLVWFNEHYGNRIGELVLGESANLTEFSESDPPVTNGSQIQNDLTIATATGGLWFTSTTGNYIGFADASYRPSFRVSVQGLGPSLLLAPGGNYHAAARLWIDGTWKSILHVAVSDSERFSSVPDLITVKPESTSISPRSGPLSMGIDLSLSSGLHHGRYTIAITVTDGLVSQTAYAFVNAA
jgi:virginiamycin B lyase